MPVIDRYASESPDDAWLKLMTTLLLSSWISHWPLVHLHWRLPVSHTGRLCLFLSIFSFFLSVSKSARAFQSAIENGSKSGSLQPVSSLQTLFRPPNRWTIVYFSYHFVVHYRAVSPLLMISGRSDRAIDHSKLRESHNSTPQTNRQSLAARCRWWSLHDSHKMLLGLFISHALSLRLLGQGSCKVKRFFDFFLVVKAATQHRKQIGKTMAHNPIWRCVHYVFSLLEAHGRS